jgi:hypothetical protein
MMPMQCNLAAVDSKRRRTFDNGVGTMPGLRASHHIADSSDTDAVNGVNRRRTNDNTAVRSFVAKANNADCHQAAPGHGLIAPNTVLRKSNNFSSQIAAEFSTNFILLGSFIKEISSPLNSANSRFSLRDTLTPGDSSAIPARNKTTDHQSHHRNCICVRENSRDS